MTGGIGKQCGHPPDRVEPGCQVCFLAEHDPEYRLLYLGESAGPPKPLVPKPRGAGVCAHLGEATGDFLNCPTCPGARGEGGSRIRLFRCEVYGQCTLVRALPGVACCAGSPKGPHNVRESCPSYSPSQSVPPPFSQETASGGATSVDSPSSIATERGGEVRPESSPEGSNSVATALGESTGPLAAVRPESSETREGGRYVPRWAYGVTTVPSRREDLLPRTLASLARAGFPDPFLFVDDVKTREARDWYYDRHRFDRLVFRTGRLKVHANWVLALYELFCRDPEAERFAVFQDDVVASRNTRAYLDQLDYPDGPVVETPGRTGREPPGYWNLYSSPNTLTASGGREGFYQTQQNGRGALGLVFSREALITLMTSRHLIERPCEPTRGWRMIDGGVVDGMKEKGWREYAHNPSLLLHTGVVCSFDKSTDKHNTGDRDVFSKARWGPHYNNTSFRGEEFDCLSLLAKR